jgi:hypothetical protein
MQKAGFLSEESGNTLMTNRQITVILPTEIKFFEEN